MGYKHGRYGPHITRYLSMLNHLISNHKHLFLIITSILYIYDFYTHYHCTVNAQFVFSVLVLLTFASLLTFTVRLGPGYLVCASLDPFCDPDLASCIGFVYLEFH